MYEVTIEREFTASHAIRMYDGELEEPHEHVWRVEVTVGAAKLDEIEVVMDFHLLEKIVSEVVGAFDGGDLNRLRPFVGDGGVGLAVNPTAERVAGFIGVEVGVRLPVSVKLVSVAVQEEAGCVAKYRTDSL